MVEFGNGNEIKEQAEVQGEGLNEAGVDFEDQKDPLTTCRVEYFRPIDAIGAVAESEGIKEGSAEYQKLSENLKELPGFMRIGDAELDRLASGFENVVNITGYSGQGVHSNQKELLEAAFEAIMQEKGWGPENSLVVSGGTAAGTPDLAVSHLVKDKGYSALGIMAIPGTAWPITQGYIGICADESWTNWGDEMEAMARVSSATIVAGGGAQALGDAMEALFDDEPIAIIANAYNGLGRAEYEIDGKRGDVMIKSFDGQEGQLFDLEKLRSRVVGALEEQGVSEEKIRTLKITDLPVSGLVTEVRKGQRRACSQDLLYFALTGKDELLGDKYKQPDEAAAEKLRAALVEDLDVYYLLDDPHEGLGGPVVVNLTHAVRQGLTGLVEKVIDHAVLHDVQDPSAGTFGPAALGAESPAELAQMLKQGLAKYATPLEQAG